MSQNQLVDFDWVVNDIVSSSVCDDHSVFAGKNSSPAGGAGGSSGSSSSNGANAGHDESEGCVGAATLREPVSCVTRLELLVNELSADGQSRQVRPHLVELSAAEIDQMIKTLKAALSA
jgi:hypothetical protein